MLMGRFVPIVAVLAIAGSLVAKPKLAPSVGTLPTDSGQFVGLVPGLALLQGDRHDGSLGKAGDGHQTLMQMLVVSE